MITTEKVMKESRLSDYNREGDEGEYFHFAIFHSA